MTSYTPTLEDIAYLAETQPESFSSIIQTKRSIANAFKGGGTDGVGSSTESLTARNHYNDYLKNGGKPLSKSPIPPAADADGDGIMDPEFAAACPECEANEPCCVISGEIMDASDTSRKLEWPYVISIPEKKPPTTMLTIADTVEGNYLVSKLNVSTSGQKCQVGKRGYPVLEAEGIIGGDQSVIVDTGTEVKIGYGQVLHMSAALRKFIPENFLYALAGFEAAWAISSLIEGNKGAVFTPSQCITDGTMATPFRVIPMSKLELDGLIDLGLIIQFTTAGINAKAHIKGNITGTVGAYEIKAEGKKTAAGEKVKSAGAKAPGLLGTMESIIGTMNEYVDMGKPDPKAVAAAKYDPTKYASGVTLSKSVKFKPMGLKLTAKPSSPDLQLKLGSLETTLAMGIQGKIDFIDAAVSVLLSPASARIVNKARARMDNPKNAVNGYVKAEVVLSCDGELKHKIKSGLNITVPADGDMSGAFDGVRNEFGGSVKIKGKALIAIHVEGKVWIVSAEAGANGSLHTGWAWEMRMNPKNTSEMQKRYYFEGLRAKAEAYVKVVVDGDDGGGDSGPSGSHTAVDLDATASGEIQVSDIMDNIAASRRAAQKLTGFTAPNSKGDWHEILRPTVPKVTDESPKWEAY